ncbi:hypothetical protein V2J09_018924, partial [Rumex salicifolius]
PYGLPLILVFNNLILSCRRPPSGLPSRLPSSSQYPPASATAPPSSPPRSIQRECPFDLLADCLRNTYPLENHRELELCFDN